MLFNRVDNKRECRLAYALQVMCVGRMRTLPNAILGLLEEFRITSAHASLERCRLLDSLEFSVQQLEVAIDSASVRSYHCSCNAVTVLCLDSYRDVIRPLPVCLWRLVEGAISAAWSDRDRHLDIEVSYFFEEDVPEQVLVDEGRLRQVLVSILSNAFRVRNSDACCWAARLTLDIQFTNCGNVILHVKRCAIEAVTTVQSAGQTHEVSTCH